MRARRSPAVRSPAVTAIRLVTGQAWDICAAELTFDALGGYGWCQLGNGGSLPLAGSSGTRVALSNELS
jgi:hypothetical protein